MWPQLRHGIQRRQPRLELALRLCGEERRKRLQPETDAGAVRHGRPALWYPGDAGRQQELRFAFSGEVHGLRDGRARLRQRRPCPALDAHELIHVGGAFATFHDICLLKSLATLRGRRASAQTSAEAISCAAERDIWAPPEATAAERETSAGLAGLLAYSKGSCRQDQEHFWKNSFIVS